MNNPFKNVSKKELKNINVNGYSFVGYWDGFYHFTKRAEYNKGGYYHIKCKECDLLDDNIKDMLELEVTK